MGKAELALAVLISLIAAAIGGFMYGENIASQAAQLEIERIEGESQRRINQALEEKLGVEEINRTLNRELGDALEAKNKAIDAANDAESKSRLRVTICKPVARKPAVSETATAGPAIDGTGKSGWYEPREVDLTDVRVEINRLGADRDKCVAKVGALQQQVDTYEKAFRAYTAGNQSK